MSFKSGQMVKHPEIDEAIRVKTSNEMVTIVERINKPKEFSHITLGERYPVYIVLTERLTVV
jgi:hypothetical protein